jgi:hypothetical protein
MEKFIFITPEGPTNKPNSDCPEPDFPEFQIIGCGHNATIDEALRDLIEINGNPLLNEVNHNFFATLQAASKHSFWLKEIHHRSNVAS